MMRCYDFSLYANNTVNILDTGINIASFLSPCICIKHSGQSASVHGRGSLVRQFINDPWAMRSRIEVSEKEKCGFVNFDCPCCSFITLYDSWDLPYG